MCIRDRIDAGQKFVGGVYALPAFAGDAHELGQTRATADEYGLEAVSYTHLDVYKRQASCLRA